jgi:general secretion pathway protein M
MSDSASSLQALRQEWQTKWSAMAPRERQMATAAAWLTVFALLVLLGIRPAWRTRSETPAQLREADAQLDGMRRMADEVQGLRQRPAVPPAQAEAALKAATDRLGEAAKLNLQGDRATLTLNKVSGDALATWLEDARSSARARPTEAALMQTEVGQYSGNIVLALTPMASSR